MQNSRLARIKLLAEKASSEYSAPEVISACLTSIGEECDLLAADIDNAIAGMEDAIKGVQALVQEKG